jgi:hypothetical protein
MASAIAAQSITATALKANSITATALAAGSITASAIASQSIMASAIAAQSIMASAIAAQSITATAIAAQSITATAIAAQSITASAIASQSIMASALAAGSVTAAAIASQSITATAIAAGSITASAIASQSIMASAMAANSIAANNIQAGAITAAAIAATAIDGMTITGAIIRTAASGARIVLDTASLNAWNTAGDNYFNMTDASGVTIMSSGYAGYDIVSLNQCANPSFETDISGWTSAQTIVRDTSQYFIGTASLKATYTSTADRVVSRFAGNADTVHSYGPTFSVYVRHDAAAAKNMHVSFYYVDASNVPVSGGTTVGSTVSVLPNTWTRLYVLTPTNAALYNRIEVTGTSFASTENMWIDAALLEDAPVANPYFDGSTASALPTYYTWSGTANLSTGQQKQQRKIKIKTGGNSVFSGPGGLTQSPGVGFLPPTTYTQTSGLYSDGQQVSLLEGSNDPSQTASITVGSQQVNANAWGVINLTSRDSVNISGQNGGVYLTGNEVKAQGRAIGFASYIEFSGSTVGIPNTTVWGPGKPAVVTARSTNTSLGTFVNNDVLTINSSGVYVVSFTLNLQSGGAVSGRTFCGFGMGYTGYQIARSTMGLGDDTATATATVRVTAGETLNFNFYQTTGGSITANTIIRVTRISDL